MIKRLNIALVILFSLFYQHCNNDSEEVNPIVPPITKQVTITNLNYQPQVFYLEPQFATFNLTGTINFENAEGGLDKLRMTYSGGGDLTITVTGADNLSSGLLTGHLEFVMPSTPTIYNFEVWVIDKKGRSSNKLTGSISVLKDDRMMYWKKVALQDASWKINRILWNSSKFVAIGNNGLILTSPDAYTWTRQVSGTSHDLFGLSFTGIQYIAVGEYSTILSSPDGVVWTKRFGSDSNEKLLGVFTSEQRYVAVGRDSAQNQGFILTSTNGDDWIKNNFAIENGEFKSVAWSGSQWMVVGNRTTDPCCRTPLCICGFWPVIITSADGVTWQDRSPVGSGMSGLHDVLWDGSRFVIAGGYYVLISADGIIWSQNPDYYSTIIYLKKVSRKDQGYIGVGPGVGYNMDLTFYSANGLNWSYNTWPPDIKDVQPHTLTDILWTGEKYVVTGLPGYVLLSPY